MGIDGQLIVIILGPVDSLVKDFSIHIAQFVDLILSILEKFQNALLSHQVQG